MGKWGVTCILLAVVLIFSMLIQGICTAQEENEDNTEHFSWMGLLPVFFGCLLFLGWACRYYEEMKLTFSLLMVFLLSEILLLLLLKARLLNFITSEQPSDKIIVYFSAVIILFILVLYYYLKKDKNNYGNKLESFLYKMRSINVIGMTLIWPIILVYFYLRNTEFIVFYGNEGLKFPVYIITASYIGIISYLLLSIEETYNQLVPEHKRLSILWSYLRRIFIAPFIAIIGFYLLSYIQVIPEGSRLSGESNGLPYNAHFLFVFSFFVGVFTKTIEDWIYAWVQKILPGDKKIEFNSRDPYEIKESDFVKILGLDEDVAYELYYDANIKTIEDLANSKPDELEKKLNCNIEDDAKDDNIENAMKLNCNIEDDAKDDNIDPGSKCYSRERINVYIRKAENYRSMGKSELVTELKMDKDLASKLYKCVNISTIADLSTRNKTYIHNRLDECNESIPENEIEKYIDRALKYMSIDKSKLVTELGMNKDLDLARKFTFLGIDDAEKLSKKNPKDVYQKLLEEGLLEKPKEDVSEDKINKYIEMADKYTKEHPK